MELYLIRHGQSQNNALPEEQRVEDPALTDVGRRQVERLGEWASTADLTRIVSSPFRRTLETALPLHHSTGLRPEVWADLYEQGGCVRGPRPEVMQGRPGLTRDEIQFLFPQFRIADDIDHRGWWRSRPYETFEQAQQRAKQTVRRTLDQFGHTAERVAFVMHGTFKLLMLRELFAEPHWHDVPLGDIYNTAVSKIRMSTCETRLEYYNEVGHLPEELIT